jgi:ABC-type glutathione transport system ATPase component
MVLQKRPENRPQNEPETCAFKTESSSYCLTAAKWLITENAVPSPENITKRYPAVLALDNVSCDLAAGEVHARRGENGAGKSTLVKIIAGAITPEGGTIALGGRTSHAAWAWITRRSPTTHWNRSSAKSSKIPAAVQRLRSEEGRPSSLPRRGE